MEKHYKWQEYRDNISVKYTKEYQSWTSKQKKQWGHYLAGFWEGEGSMTVSFKEHKTSKFGLYIDPEVSLTQSVEGIHLLIWAKCHFRTGRVFLKSGTTNIWVYSITNRKSILENFVPFFEKHMFLWTGKQKTFTVYKEIILRLENKDHSSLEGAKEIARLGYQINSTKGKGRKRSLSEVLRFMDESNKV